MLNKIDSASPVRASGSVSSPSVIRRIASGSAEARDATATRSGPASGNARAGTEIGKGLLERAGERAQSTPEVDTARVDEVKAAIARGEFRIDSKAVARAFMALESA